MRLKFTGATVARWSLDDPNPGYGGHRRLGLTKQPTSLLVDKLTEDVLILETDRNVQESCHINADTTGVLISPDVTRVHLLKGADLVSVEFQLVSPSGWIFVTHKDPAMGLRIFLNLRRQMDLIRSEVGHRHRKVTCADIREVEITAPLEGKSEETILAALLNIEKMEELRRQQAVLLNQLKQALLNTCYIPKKNDPKADAVEKLKIEAALA